MNAPIYYDASGLFVVKYTSGGLLLVLYLGFIFSYVRVKELLKLARHSGVVAVTSRTNLVQYKTSMTHNVNTYVQFLFVVYCLTISMFDKH